MEKLEGAPESLAEIVAQLHWKTQAQRPGLPGGMVLLQPGDEVLCVQFGTQISQLGFTQVQRLVPPGVPFINPQQPLYKYTSPSAPSLVYQMGVDLLSVHLVKPFKAWGELVGEVQRGVDMLQSALALGGNTIAFESLTLRYIHGFGDVNSATLDWLTRILGITVSFPSALSSAMSTDTSPDFSFNLKTILTANDATTLTLAIRKGDLEGAPRIIMDSALILSHSIAGDAVSDSLNTLHGQWCNVFQGMTRTSLTADCQEGDKHVAGH
ncbi:hypothetical protein HF668_01840 [Acidithiobacillus ferridurans]|uniref:hypothetical protein n=1 Tax=Acidithiobacillus ferridurans TaxID=1232575 RepID=UPI001C06666E|nr:hypothetical protein [Acidithiobacillus ferridurans]MBU2803923.1 hypothetical protein [Acidithiobacillus ferridurans]